MPLAHLPAVSVAPGWGNTSLPAECMGRSWNRVPISDGEFEICVRPHCCMVICFWWPKTAQVVNFACPTPVVHPSGFQCLVYLVQDLEMLLFLFVRSFEQVSNLGSASTFCGSKSLCLTVQATHQCKKLRTLHPVGLRANRQTTLFVGLQSS